MSDELVLVFAILPIGLTCGLIAGHVITVKRFRRVYDENKEKSQELAARDIRIAELEAESDRLRDALLAVKKAVPGTDDAAYRVQCIVSEALAGREDKSGGS